MTQRFYENLPACTFFSEITNPAFAQPVPPDWWVALTDIRGSTEAIARGRYKEVNMVGASAIVAVLNCAGDIEIPFVFGGDGATLLIPPGIVDQVRAALQGTCRMAQTGFNLSLRVGLIPVVKLGAELRLARFRVHEHYQQGIILGSGLSAAERLLKDPKSPYLLTDDPGQADFQGLECRWQDLRGTADEVVSLLVQVTTAQDPNGLYRQVILEIERIYGIGSPIKVEQLALTFSPKQLAVEARLQKTWSHQVYIWKTQLINSLGWLLMEWGSWRPYKPLVVATTDYRKFDDVLRMTLSGTPSQRSALTTFLETYRDQLAYGLQVADRALLTCLVFERFGRQVHFLDGAGGGYALAAQQLKQQLSAQ